MPDPSAQPDVLEERVCSLVGRFSYHFSRIEPKIDQALIKLLDLDERSAPIVLASLQFFARKVALVKDLAPNLPDAESRQFAEDTCDEVFRINDARTIVSHSYIEVASGGDVQFKKPVAKEGLLRAVGEPWDDARFRGYYGRMIALEPKLDKLIELIRPVPSNFTDNLSWLVQDPFQPMRRMRVPWQDTADTPLPLRDEAAKREP